MTLANRQLLVIEFVVFLVAWASIARAFWWPRIAALDRRAALRVLIAPQMFRIIGMTLLAHNVPAPGLDPDFARWVAIGDAVTAALALLAFQLLARPGRPGIALALATTAVGGVDLLHNLARGMQVNAAEYLGAGWFVVTVVVPLMMVAHAGAALTLARRG